MRVVRGRRETPQADREYTKELIDAVGETGEPAVRVWQPHEQLVFGRRDTNRDGYERAREAATAQGVPVVERTVGGHAVYYTGGTISFLRAAPSGELRTGIDARYERITTELQAALADLGVEAREGEPPGSFCPGAHSLTAEGKIVGLAQRVRRDVAVVAGILLVAEHERIARVLEPVYDALELAFDPESTGSLARAGGETDPRRVRHALEESLVDGPSRIESVRQS